MSSNDATLLFLDLPKGALVAIDLFVFQAAVNTRGVTNLPPGLHFVFASSNEATASRQGTWFRVDGSEIIAKRWDASKEELVDGASSQQALRQGRIAGLGLDDRVIPYAVFTEQSGVEHAADDWQQLTSCISTATLNRILGDGPNSWTIASTSTAAADLETIPGLGSAVGKAFQAEKQLVFVPINLKKRVWRDGATGRERTEAARDHSWYLSDLVHEHLGGQATELLGEMQFCFIMNLLLNNFSCLEQWKRIIGLFLTSRSAASMYLEVYIELFKLLKTQLDWSATTETDVFDMSDGGKTFFITHMRNFRDLCSEIDDGRAKSKVFDSLDELEEYLEAKFDWDFEETVMKRKIVGFDDGETVEVDLLSRDLDDEIGEFAPTIVDLTPEQLRILHGDNAVPRTMEGLTLQDHASADEEQEEEEEEGDLDDLDMRY